jgi:hypothetical protein
MERVNGRGKQSGRERGPNDEIGWSRGSARRSLMGPSIHRQTAITDKVENVLTKYDNSV